MTEFQEDMIFKDVCEEDARTFLNILGKKSKKVKIITKELRQLDPTTFVPDIILELDDEILIIELQSIKLEKKHHQRFYIYVAISTYRLDKIKKEVNLCVFTTAEKSKQVTYKINKDNVFKYDVISLSDYDADEIINTINYKLENDIEITAKELILFSLVPIIEKTGDVEKYIDYVVDTLIEFKDLPHSIKSLLYGIEWLIVDKFVVNVQKRNILCDLLGDRMSLMYEYGENKEKKGIQKGIKQGIKQGVQKGEDNIILNLLRAGQSPHKIASDAGVPLSRVNAIKRRFNL